MEIVVIRKEKPKKIGRPKGQKAISGQRIEAEQKRIRAVKTFEANLTFVDRLIYEGLEDRKIAKSLATKTGEQINETMVRDRRYKLEGKRTAG